MGINVVETDDFIIFLSVSEVFLVIVYTPKMMNYVMTMVICL